MDETNCYRLRLGQILASPLTPNLPIFPAHPPHHQPMTIYSLPIRFPRWQSFGIAFLLLYFWALAAQAEISPIRLPHPETIALSSPGLENLPTIEPQQDPLNSPFPVPWQWIIDTQQELSQQPQSEVRYYRTNTLVSPDGQYEAYSRIRLESKPQLYESKVTSILFLQNNTTGELQLITASSPLAQQAFLEEFGDYPPGAMSILIPVSWSKNGDRLLSRQLEGFFSTSDVSDYGVIWDQEADLTTTLSPQNVEYSHAVLMGWNARHKDQVIFKAGHLGDETMPTWAVQVDGETRLTQNNPSEIYSHFKSQIWAGPHTAGLR